MITAYRGTRAIARFSLVFHFPQPRRRRPWHQVRALPVCVPLTRGQCTARVLHVAGARAAWSPLEYGEASVGFTLQAQCHRRHM